MRQLSFKRHRFPADIIRPSIWLYARFTLSFRDVEEMLAERGLDVSYETVLPRGDPTLSREGNKNDWRAVFSDRSPSGSKRVLNLLLAAAIGGSKRRNQSWH